MCLARTAKYTIVFSEKLIIYDYFYRPDSPEQLFTETSIQVMRSLQLLLIDFLKSFQKEKSQNFDNIVKLFILEDNKLKFSCRQ